MKVAKDGVKAADFTSSDLFKNATEALPAIVMGHARAATGGTPSGPHDNANNHPFFGKLSRIAMIHNGTVDDDLWRKTVGKEGGINPKYDFEGQTDSELFLRMVETCLESCATMEEAIADAAYNIEGNYALVFIRETEPSKIWFVKHNNPIVFALNEKSSYIVWGSTPDIIQHALTTYKFHLDYFCEPVSPKLVYEDQGDESIVTIELIDAEPWFKISARDFIPKGSKIHGGSY